ncbi:MAG: ABC transporter ATP-binding protein [Acidimicrobiia bacterium]|nr:ABC transporter ATP-binding protein [Acidimicrobiia bacterium]
MTATDKTSSGAMLSTHGLYKAFGGNVAVHDVSLDLYPDRITALIGPNGAGKTTLFNIITGYERPDSGDITFDGNRVGGMAPWQISRRGVARTFQTPVGFPTMTLWESMQVAGASHAVLTGMLTTRGRRETAKLSRRADEILDHLGLDKLLDTPVDELAAGDRKLAELARQLMSQPRLLLLDEPAAGVNPGAISRLSDLIRDVHRSGIALMIIDHNLSFVLDVADYVHVMANGRIIAEGTPEEIAASPLVRQVYMGVDA